MLTNVVVVAPPGATWSDFNIPVLAPGSNGLFIAKVDGLEPVENTINTQSYAADGEYYVGGHRGKRNIVLHLEMETRGFDISAVRDDLYGFFYTQSFLWLRLEFDDRSPVVIQGYPESHEGDRFAQDPEISVSIICPKPNFIDPTLETETGMTGIDPAMTTLVNLGNQSIGFQIQITPNEGAVELGRLIFFTGVESDVPGVYSTTRTFEMDASNYDDDITSDEVFVLDSRQGQKSVYLLDTVTGAKRNALKDMTSDSRWPILHPGNNHFRIATPEASVDRVWDVVWQSEFGGV